MHQLSEKELSRKIDAFLSKKLSHYPETRRTISVAQETHTERFSPYTVRFLQGSGMRPTVRLV